MIDHYNTIVSRDTREKNNYLPIYLKRESSEKYRHAKITTYTVTSNGSLQNYFNGTSIHWFQQG
jgi:hypothetical protein